MASRVWVIEVFWLDMDLRHLDSTIDTNLEDKQVKT